MLLGNRQFVVESLYINEEILSPPKRRSKSFKTIPRTAAHEESIGDYNYITFINIPGGNYPHNNQRFPELPTTLVKHYLPVICNSRMPLV